MNLIPPNHLPWPFRRKNPIEFFECTCKNCGFKCTYVVGNFMEVVIHEGSPESAMEHVKELPTACPRCGGKLHSEKLPNLIRD